MGELVGLDVGHFGLELLGMVDCRSMDLNLELLGRLFRGAGLRFRGRRLRGGLGHLSLGDPLLLFLHPLAFAFCKNVVPSCVREVILKLMIL